MVIIVVINLLFYMGEFIYLFFIGKFIYNIKGILCLIIIGIVGYGLY